MVLYYLSPPGFPWVAPDHLIYSLNAGGGEVNKLGPLLHMLLSLTLSASPPAFCLEILPTLLSPPFSVSLCPPFFLSFFFFAPQTQTPLPPLMKLTLSHTSGLLYCFLPLPLISSDRVHLFS